MAMSPHKMVKPKEEVDLVLVKRLEREVDEFLENSEKGLKEYLVTWHCYYPLIDLQTVANLYQNVGWVVECASDEATRVSSIRLKQPLKVNPISSKIKHNQLLDPNADHQTNMPHVVVANRQYPPATKPAILPE